MPRLSIDNADMPRNKALKQVLADNVKKAMSDKKLSQPQVAALAKQKGLKIDQTTVGRIARGAMPATVDTLEALARGLGVDAWRLLQDGADPAVDGVPITEDERELLQRYRTSTDRWKIAIRYMAGLRHDSQQEEAASYVLSKVFATPASDARVEAAYGLPPGRATLAVHQGKPDYTPKAKKPRR